MTALDTVPVVRLVRAAGWFAALVQDLMQVILMQVIQVNEIKALTSSRGAA